MDSECKYHQLLRVRVSFIRRRKSCHHIVYRDEQYNPSTDENRNIAEISLAKQRNGPTGLFRLTFLKEYARFENYAEEEPYL